jgi:hypothetical protein
MHSRSLVFLLGLLALPALVQADADDKVNAVLKVLVGGKEIEKVQALKDLAALGEDGKPATRAVAAAMWSKNKDIQKQAIEAFGKIQPDMLKPALRLLLEKEVTRADFELICKLDGKASIPMIRGRINKDVAAKNLVGINEGILALVTIGGGDEEATDALIRLCTFRLDGISRDYRDLAANGLAIHSNFAKGELRERVVVGLNNILVTQQKQKKPRATEGEQVLAVAVIKALGRYGKDAAKAAPTLKALRLDKDAKIRNAAIDALKDIEGE